MLVVKKYGMAPTVNRTFISAARNVYMELGVVACNSIVRKIATSEQFVTLEKYSCKSKNNILANAIRISNRNSKHAR